MAPCVLLLEPLKIFAGTPSLFCYKSRRCCHRFSLHFCFLLELYLNFAGSSNRFCYNQPKQSWNCYGEAAPWHDGVGGGSVHQSCKQAKRGRRRRRKRQRREGSPGGRGGVRTELIPWVDETETPDRTGIIAKIGRLRVDRPKLSRSTGA